MPSYSKNSDRHLKTATGSLQRLFDRVVTFYDNTIIQGWRPLSEQHALFNSGRSKVKRGKHNEVPSQAVDSAPYINGRIPWPQTPTDWTDAKQRNAYIKDLNQFYHYGGFVLGVAAAEGIKIRWGGDWDRDNDLADQSFNDMVHFEDLKTPEE